MILTLKGIMSSETFVMRLIDNRSNPPRAIFYILDILF